MTMRETVRDERQGRREGGLGMEGDIAKTK